MLSTSGVRRGCNAVLTAAFVVLSAGGASAVDPRDLKNCQDSDDVPRMIAASTNLSQDTGLPPPVRSMAKDQAVERPEANRVTADDYARAGAAE